jgi:hypothetical protein
MPKAMEQDEPPTGTSGGIPKSRIVLYLIVLVVGLVVWKNLGESDPPPAQTVPKAKKVKRVGSNPGAIPADSTRIKSTAASRLAKDYSEPLPAPEDLAVYEFVRTPWEKPQSPALAGRLRRMDQGYNRHPMARFQGVEGRLVFLRPSNPVHRVPDRSLDRIPEKSILEFLPAWYQRGFTLHLRGHRRPFRPMHFRLQDPPGAKVPIDTAEDPLIRYAVHAYVDADEALLIYPDTEPREGPNGWVAAEDLRLPEGMPGFGAAYFAKVTGGKVDAVKTFSLPDREYRLVEVHARRDSPGQAPGDTLRRHRGIYVFAVHPREGKVAFLVHDFDRRYCQEDKDIRFLGLVNVAGDETAEILLGSKPHFLVHEDADGLKYHFEASYTCEEPGV